MNIILNIAKDFSSTIKNMRVAEGEKSAEAFYTEQLQPKFQEAINTGSMLDIVFDGVKRYSTNFLQEAFGTRMGRDFKYDQMSKHITLTCKENPALMKEVYGIIRQHDYLVCDKCGRKVSGGQIDKMCNKPIDNSFLPCTGKLKKVG